MQCELSLCTNKTNTFLCYFYYLWCWANFWRPERVYLLAVQHQHYFTTAGLDTLFFYFFLTLETGLWKLEGSKRFWENLRNRMPAVLSGPALLITARLQNAGLICATNYSTKLNCSQELSLPSHVPNDHWQAWKLIFEQNERARPFQFSKGTYIGKSLKPLDTFV